MSWSLSLTGTPPELVAAIEAHGEQLDGLTKKEFEAAKPHLVGLVQQNFKREGHGYVQGPLALSASGHAVELDGEIIDSNCTAHLRSA